VKWRYYVNNRIAPRSKLARAALEELDREFMTKKKITTAGDVYKFVERFKTASQHDGAAELYRQLDQAMRLGSSSLEILGAIQQAVIRNQSDVERLLETDGSLCADQVIAFVNKHTGAARSVSVIAIFRQSPDC
jgi:hypothetical protein